MQWESFDRESTDSADSEYSYQSGCESESESDDGVTWEDTDDSDYIPHPLPQPLKIVSRGPIAIRSVAVDGGLRPGQAKKQDRNTFSFGRGYECCSLSHTDGPPCTVLKVLGLKYSAPIKAIVNPSKLMGPWIIPAARLRYYIKNHCAGQFKLGRTCTTEAEWDAIAQHILHGHCIPTTQTSDTLATTLPRQLANPIPSTVPPRTMFKCPKSGCSYCAAAASGQPKEDANITRHYREQHGTRGKDLIKINFRPTLQQKCFLLGSDGNSAARTHTFSLLPWESSPLAYQLPDPPMYQDCEEEDVVEHQLTGTWMKETGWDAYVSNLGSDQEIAGILRLIEEPSPTNLNLTSRAEHIEKGLLYVYEFAVDYLKNCNDYLDYKDALVRQAVSAGSVNKKSKHENVQLRTLKTYSKLISLTVAFMVRVLEIEAEATPSGESRCLGNFKIMGHPAQIQAASRLRDYFVGCSGDCDSETADPLIHDIFDALLRPPSLEDTPIACPTDQILLLMSLLGHGKYVTANKVSSHCAALQYCLRCIFVHVARLRAFHLKHYHHWIPPSATHHNTEGESDIEAAPHIEEACSNPGLPQSDPDAFIKKFDEQIMRFLRAEGSWVKMHLEESPNFPYQRMKNVAYIVAIPARYKEHSATSFQVSSDGQQYTFHDTHETPQQIRMAEWKNTAVQLCRDILPKTLRSMMPQPEPSNLESVLNSITDSLTPEAVHRQLHNIPLLEPIHNQVLEGIIRSFGIQPSGPSSTLHADNPAYVAWRTAEQKTLTCIAAILILTTGPCMRDFQIRGLRYDSKQDVGVRNLFFISNGAERHVIFGTPAAKQRDRDVAGVCFALPPLITDYLRLYFFVLRPVGLALLHKAQLEAPLYSHVIWIDTRHRRNRTKLRDQWSSRDLTARIQKATKKGLGFLLTPRVARQICHAVCRSKLPSLFTSAATAAPAIKISLESGRLQEYGGRYHFPVLQGMNSLDCSMNMLVSHIWQALFELCPLDPAWQELVEGSHMFPTRRFTVGPTSPASSCARYLVRELYGATVVANADSAQRVKQTLWEPPFLRGGTVCLSETTPFGDRVLREVTHTVLFGDTRPQVTATPPLGGLHVEDVAQAVYLIYCAWEDHTCGMAGRTTNPSFSIPALIEQLKVFKAKCSSAWIQFSKEVYACRVPPLFTTTRLRLNLEALMPSDE